MPEQNRLSNLRTTYVDLDGVLERADPDRQPAVRATIQEVERQIAELEEQLEEAES